MATPMIDGSHFAEGGSILVIPNLGMDPRRRVQVDGNAVSRTAGAIPIDPEVLEKLEKLDPMALRFNPVSALILVDNSNGFTAMAHNRCHGEGLPPSGAAVTVISGGVAIVGNQVLSDAHDAFWVHAQRGLFTSNLSDRPNALPDPADVEQAVNPQV